MTDRPHRRDDSRDLRTWPLPSPRSSFVGRDRELTQLAGALEADGALVTVVGPPGTGKTRLALEHARREDASGEATAFVDLTAATSLRDVIAPLAAALGEPLGAADELDDELQQLGRTLTMLGRVLVVVDNCEHLLDEASSTVTALRAQAPRARFLVTSRQRLEVADEVVFALAPLPVPDEGDAELESIEAHDSVALFIERARGRDACFALEAEEASTMTRLVRALDGNPLAIELCAARVGVLGLTQLLGQLQRRFDLLRARAPISDARWSSLDGALQLSWDLLDPTQRSALAQLAVFRDGFTREAAARVVLVEGDDDATIDGVIDALVERSLVESAVRARAGGEDRLWLFESVREFAWARLEETGGGDATCRRHAQYYLEALGPTPRTIHLGGGEETQRRLEAERANLFAVHDRAMAQEPPLAEEALKALVALAPLCSTQGPLGEYLRLLETASAAAAEQVEADPLVRVGVLIATALVESRRGRFETSCRALEQALPLARKAGAVEVEAYILVVLGGMLPFLYREREVPKVFERARKLIESLGDDHLQGLLHKEVASTMMWRAPDKAASFLKRALLLFRMTGDAVRVAYTHGHLCTCQYACGDLVEAERHGAEALARLTELGDERWAAHIRTLLALIGDERGDVVDVDEVLSDALEVQHGVGNRWLEAFLHMALGETRLERGRLDESLASYTRALEISRPLDERATSSWTLSGLGAALAAQDRPDEAAAYFDDAEAHARQVGIPALQQALELRRGHLELARSRAAAAEGDAGSALRWLDAAGARLEPWSSSGRRARKAPSHRDQVLVRRSIRALARAVDDTRRAVEGGLRVHCEGLWFSVGAGEPVSLKSRDPLRRVLRALVDHRLERPGAGLPLEALFAAGWPGERAKPASAANRVYVTLTRLRKAGLGDLITSCDQGFLLDPAVPLSVVE